MTGASSRGCIAISIMPTAFSSESRRLGGYRPSPGAPGKHLGHEKIGRGRLTNDTLIAMSAARKGVIVLTANEREFSRLARFCRFQWQIVPAGEAVSRSGHEGRLGTLTLSKGQSRLEVKVLSAPGCDLMALNRIRLRRLP